MGIDVASANAALAAALRADADAVRGAGQRAYLKLERECWGVRIGELRRATKAALSQYPDLDHDDLVGWAQASWAGPTFEERRAAAELLVQRVGLLEPDDLVWIEDWCRSAETWAILDELAPRVVGPIVERFPTEGGATLDRWAVDGESFWVRRAALLALLIPLREGRGDWERFTRYADSMLHEREFFVAKAIGWVARDTSRRRPDLVRAWVLPRHDRMGAVTRREAMKYL